jgi:hypothetical protein
LVNCYAIVETGKPNRHGEEERKERRKEGGQTAEKNPASAPTLDRVDLPCLLAPKLTEMP